RLTLQSNTVALDEASVRFVDDISAALRNRLNEDISNSDFIARLKNKIRTDIANRIDNSLGGEQRRPSVPIAPLGGRIREDIAQRVEQFIQLKKAELRARVDALVARGVDRRAVVGIDLARCIFTEVGYRALSVDYQNNGFLFDTITHGPQITTGITF